MKAMRQRHDFLEFKRYKGSLDFPCDFCNSNSYDNYHLSKDRKIEFVFCDKCFKEVKEERKKK